MNNIYSLEKYKKSDKPEMIQLIKSVWGKDIAGKGEISWDWKYDNNPFNPAGEPMILLLKKNNIIAGFIASISTPLKIGQNISTNLCMVDLMVDPKYRGAGIKLMKGILSEKYVLFGMPNEVAYLIWKKLKGIDCCKIDNNINIIRMDNIIKKKINNKLLLSVVQLVWEYLRCLPSVLNGSLSDSALSLTEVSNFGNEMDKFWDEVSGDYENIIVRNKKYLNWRFIDVPNKDYKVILAKKNDAVSGYIVARCEEKNELKYGYIVDFLTRADDKVTLNLLFSKIVGLLESEGVDLITCLVTSYNKYQRNVLLRNGFIFKKKGNKMIAYAYSVENFNHDLLSRNKWFVTKSDSDLDM